MITRTKTINIFTKKRLIWAEIGLLILLGSLYLFFVSSAVLSAVTRDNAISEARDISSGLTDLERQYLARSGTLSKNIAYQSGLSDIKDVHFINTRQSDTLLSYREER